MLVVAILSSRRRFGGVILVFCVQLAHFIISHGTYCSDIRLNLSTHFFKGLSLWCRFLVWYGGLNTAGDDCLIWNKKVEIFIVKSWALSMFLLWTHFRLAAYDMRCAYCLPACVGNRVEDERQMMLILLFVSVWFTEPTLKHYEESADCVTR